MIAVVYPFQCVVVLVELGGGLDRNDGSTSPRAATERPPAKRVPPSASLGARGDQGRRVSKSSHASTTSASMNSTGVATWKLYESSAHAGSSQRRVAAIPVSKT